MKVRVLGALLLLIGAVNAATAPPAAAAAELTVTPATQLIDLDRVLVEATGFRPGALIGACQTIPGADDSSDCAAGTLVTATASSDGSVAVEVVVRRFAVIPSLGRTIDCADPAEPCVIGAAEAFDIVATVVVRPITFAPVPPPPATRGSITVSPDDGLVHGDVVTVEGTGFRPDVDVAIDECVPGPVTQDDCRRETPDVVRTDAAGSFSTEVRVNRLFYRPSGEPIVDCASSPCTVAASERVDFPGTVVTAPISFEPPTGEPAVSVTPDRDLRAGDVVTVSGVNFLPTEIVRAWQCSSERACGPNVDAVVARDGTFRMSLTLSDPGGDCRSPEATCRVVVQESNLMMVSLEVPITFAPPDPPPPAVLTGGATVVEGDGPTTVLEVPVTLSAPSGKTVTVEWETVYDPTWSDLAAVPGLDYVPASGTVSFAPGATEATVTIAVIGDELPEGGELLAVSFHDPTNARMGGLWRLGLGGIADDDGPM